ncbi:hypothetical protein ROZALSC1DRAFT_24725 [Rozella allomycis CSF55]|uniref:Uncharacterized protein n=1 Tax=Rozella allomycis (strain CSF55) TaxID=988480 RepID=A0A4P9YE59_ROZAC|nr:hypothetical protein ROZALSC1DRAFT_24725 [Rozella allomycis CSF55]
MLFCATKWKNCLRIEHGIRSFTKPAHFQQNVELDFAYLDTAQTIRVHDFEKKTHSPEQYFFNKELGFMAFRNRNLAETLNFLELYLRQTLKCIGAYQLMDGMVRLSELGFQQNSEGQYVNLGRTIGMNGRVDNYCKFGKKWNLKQQLRFLTSRSFDNFS